MPGETVTLLLVAINNRRRFDDRDPKIRSHLIWFYKSPTNFGCCTRVQGSLKFLGKEGEFSEFLVVLKKMMIKLINENLNFRFQLFVH